MPEPRDPPVEPRPPVVGSSVMTVRQATAADAGLVGELVFRLIGELAPEAADGIELGDYRRTAVALLEAEAPFWALLADDPAGAPVGVLTLNECAAIYAGGRFGEIAELFVEPRHRSSGVAAELLRAAVAFGRERGWGRLEVGAPTVPRWQRTVSFYLKQGFLEVGPRLKRSL